MSRLELPQNQGLELRIQSLPSAKSNSTMKKPLAQGYMEAFSLIVGFQA
jgi:hypothetical protein